MKLAEVLKQRNFDLHMHTTASDGDYSPSELVHKAALAGLGIIAITDHDTLAGIEEAQQAGLELGIEVIAGIEVSTKHNGKSIDILGYGLNESDELTDVLSGLRDGREERAQRIIKKFTELGMPLTLDNVKEFSLGGVMGRPHIAKAIVKKGYVNNVQQVFDEYLADGKPCALDKVVLTPQQGIDLIHQADGFAVIAHPVLIGDDDLVRELLQSHNFDGIEVWHRQQRPADNARYKQMAEQYGLLQTGGSDYHNDSHQLGQFGLHNI